jgi:uncharacterized cupredoxin-like copper-binding protein
VIRARRLRLAVLAAGGLVVAAWGAPGPARPQEPELVTVVMTEYAFQPSELRFRQGVAYRLHLENRGRELHEFTAPDFFKAATVANPRVLVQDGREVVLQPGEQKDVELVPERAGRYDLRCADHDWAGMIGEITIE